MNKIKNRQRHKGQIWTSKRASKACPHGFGKNLASMKTLPSNQTRLQPRVHLTHHQLQEITIDATPQYYKPLAIESLTST